MVFVVIDICIFSLSTFFFECTGINSVFKVRKVIVRHFHYDVRLWIHSSSIPNYFCPVGRCLNIFFHIPINYCMKTVYGHISLVAFMPSATYSKNHLESHKWLGYTLHIFVYNTPSCYCHGEWGQLKKIKVRRRDGQLTTTLLVICSMPKTLRHKSFSRKCSFDFSARFVNFSHN